MFLTNPRAIADTIRALAALLWKELADAIATAIHRHRPDLCPPAPIGPTDPPNPGATG